MPRIQRNQGAAIIEVSIPLSLSRSADDSEEDDACFICAHPYCSDAECQHSATNMRCCSQPLCCGCVIKVARRCKCTDDCEAVIAICPFCRDIVAVGALEIFLATRSPCKLCLKRTREETARTVARDQEPQEDAHEAIPEQDENVAPPQEPEQ